MARFLARAARQSSLLLRRDLQEYTAGQQELPVQLYNYLAPGVINVDSVAEFAKGVHRRGSSDRIKDIARIE